MRRMSQKRAAIEREMKKAKLEVRQERPNICQCGCMRPPSYDEPIDCSHNFPIKHFLWLACEKNNITLLKRKCHDNWERNHFWKIDNVVKILELMWELVDEEFDVIRRKSMRDHIMNKILKCGDFVEGIEISEQLLNKWEKR